MTSEETKNSKAHSLATSTDQPPERSHVCEPVHKLDLEGWLSGIDGSPWPEVPRVSFTKN